MPPLSTTDLVDESVPVLGLLAVYGLFAVVSEYGVREIGSTGSIVSMFGRFLAVLFVVGVGLSVFVDLDHFLIARWAAGDWSHLWRVFGAPRRAFSDPGFVFPDLEFPWLRLASHVVIAALLGLGASTVDVRLAAFLVGILVVHIVADVLRDQQLL